MNSVKRRAAAAAAAAVVAAAAACSGTASVAGRPSVSGPVPAGKYLGVAVPGIPKSYAPVTSFAALTGTAPEIAEYYSGWQEPFNAAFAAAARQHGSYVLVNINPGVSLARIAAGGYDAYLRSYARAVRAFGHPVIISFAHEPDGPWWAWGDTRIPASRYVSAWRHVVDVFRAEGAANVTWLWTLAVTAQSPDQLRALYPGDAYVSWVGLNGYFAHPALTYATTFGPTMAEVRTFTSKPFLIAETGVPSHNGTAVAGQVAGLFKGAEASPDVTGLIWFDYTQKRPAQDWDLSDDPATLAAFREAAAQWGK